MSVRAPAGTAASSATICGDPGQGELELACALKHAFGQSSRPARRFAICARRRSDAVRLGCRASPGTLSTLPYGTQRHLGSAWRWCGNRWCALDEPTAGNEPAERAASSTCCFVAGSLTLLIVEHDMDVIFELAERISVLDLRRVLLKAPGRGARLGGGAQPLLGVRD